MFRNFDDMFGNVDKMMNDMMNNPFGFGPGLSLMNNMLIPPMSNSLTPFGNNGGNNLFSMIGSNGVPGQNFSYSSSFTTISNDGSGQPQVYQASKSQVCGPNGLKETTETVKDSRTGLHQMTYGRHIKDRAHIKQKKRNVYNGEEEEEDEYLNLDEEEAEKFHKEFKKKRSDYIRSNPTFKSLGYSRNHKHNKNQRLAITNEPSTSNYIPKNLDHLLDREKQNMNIN